MILDNKTSTCGISLPQRKAHREPQSWPSCTASTGNRAGVNHGVTPSSTLLRSCQSCLEHLCHKIKWHMAQPSSILSGSPGRAGIPQTPHTSPLSPWKCGHPGLPWEAQASAKCQGNFLCAVLPQHDTRLITAIKTLGAF